MKLPLWFTYDLAMADEWSRRQFHNRVQELIKENAELRDERDKMRKVAYSNGQSASDESDRAEDLSRQLAEMTAKAERQWEGWVKEECVRKDAERQLAEMEVSRDHWIGESQRILKAGQDAAYRVDELKTALSEALKSHMRGQLASQSECNRWLAVLGMET